ncbi:MAG TPA: S-adenosyl-l-methionine hydroxide adenosyltransferase family protein [Ohtaekwangia sp.]|uniref:SAM hydrolase/SAM-dependent halogenase family protein n=1 Tax=Ohtaekwangia sp. TaxID=2066019 RepID=UPI002F93EB5C
MIRYTFLVVLIVGLGFCGMAQNKALVFQSDFGLKDGAVSEMKGVAFSVSPELKLFDVTHEIPAYNIWEAAYRLFQAAPYWPPGTVFVSIVDPGVGSERKSVVLKTKSGHYFVSPDNGTLTLVAERLGIDEVRQINEAVNRLKNSEKSYTFHGRDVYAFTGARLASGTIRWEEVGPKLAPQVVSIDYQKPVIENGIIKGNIPVLDVQYGNVWTNIDQTIFQKLGVKLNDKLHVIVYKDQQTIFEGDMPYVNTFSAVPEGQTMAYMNSLLNFSVAINQGSFSEKYKVYSGAEWSIVIRKTNR